MGNFIVSARKYRPQTFDTVVGQKSITNTLKNAILNNHLAQAFLFCGPRGVGKTTCARILAKTINCFNISEQTEACNTCESCTSFNEQHSFNIHELDAASNNSVDDIRSLVDQVRIPPQVGDRKIYIIDEVHMLSQAAFNAFLKTLEEPPAHAIFILATTEKHKIIPTILSRCQIFDFKRIQVEDVANHLAEICEKESIEFESDALHIIGQKADGALRDGLSIFDRMVSFNQAKITYKDTLENLNILDYDYYFKVVDQALKQDIPSTLLTFNEILKKGFDGHNFMNGLAEHLRNVLVCKNPQTIELLEVGDTIKTKYLEQSQSCHQDFILAALEICNECDVNYKSSRNQRLLAELSLMQICSLSSEGGLKKKRRKSFILAHTAYTNATTEVNKVAPKSVKEHINKSHTQTPEITEPAKAQKAVLKKANPVFINKLKKGGIAGLSINKFLNKKEENQEDQEYVVATGEARSDFHQDQLNPLWLEFAKTIEAKGKVSLFRLFSAQFPKIDTNFLLHFPVESQALADDLQVEKPELLSFLRKKLNNFGINIDFPLIEAENTKMLYTPQDKFKHMVEKNQQLQILKKSLDLDLL
ncbi:MAG: DNA polymerase III subunit gamma/tau [Polaribacter sp.]|jgi:DNA polymerase-3 subunit gamma/tau|nr:DNA polymerase III subunit gamma/tau [Polaribacter sp.]